MNINFGIRTLLLLLAVLLFILAVFTKSGGTYSNLLAWGFASVAAAFLLGDIGWDRKFGGRRRP